MPQENDETTRNDAGTRSQSINIPARRTNTNSNEATHNSSRRSGISNEYGALATSPEQVDGQLGISGRSNTSVDTLRQGASSQPTRPRLGSRNSSSPIIPRGRAAQSTSRFASSLTTPRHAPPERQWSVFGQLMENEGQLRSPAVSPRRPSLRPSVRIEHNDGHNNTFLSRTDHGGDPFTTAELPTPNPVQAQPTSPTSSVHSSPRPESFSDDEEYDSDDSISNTAFVSPATDESRPAWYSPRRLPTVPLLYRNVLKCAIAYFVASLFTFSPHLSSMLGSLTSYGPGDGNRRPSPTGHMVATIAVYFNPAKTMGAMVDADLYCFIGLLYSAFVSLSSMTMFWWLEVKPGWEWLADLLAISWIGLSMSALAWTKVWMVACSMTVIIVFVVLIREGGLETLLQVSTIVLIGSLVSNAVCYLIWPQTAYSNLQINMTQTLDSFSTLLTMLTKTFLLEDEFRKPSHEKLHKAIEHHQSSFTSLKKNLSEARSEWFHRSPRTSEDGQGGNRSRRAYEDAVDSLNRLGQHLNGLRSGTRLQYELTRAGVVGRKNKSGKHRGADVEDDEETAILRAAAVMFGDLVDDLGPPLRALSSTCTFSLKRLRESFVKSRAQQRKKDKIEPQDFHELADGIERALIRFESTSNHAVLRLYRKSEASTVYMSQESSIASLDPHASISSLNTEQRDNAMLAGANHEHVFLVYFFIFTLQEFSRELVSLVDAMGRIYHFEQQMINRGPWWKRLMKAVVNLTCRIPWRKSGSRNQTRKRPGLKRSLSAFMTPSSPRTHPSFPKVRPHAPNTIQTPPWGGLTLIGKIKQTLWIIGKRLGERDTKYAIKAGMATAILAAPAFFDSTRQFFIAYWGDWALISFFIVISPTIGATNHLSTHRILGTLFGAAVAAGIYTIFPDDALVLSIFGFFFSLPCFYFAVSNPQYLSASRFVLLTYNLTCLYCYNLREDDLSVLYVASHRALAVTIGVVWAALVSRFWWPAEARRELGKALGEFCLNIGWLYTRLVASNSFAPEYRNEQRESADESPEATTFVARQENTSRLNNSIEEFMSMELHLQIKLIELQGLLAQTQHEPRLKGPFPVQLYRGILTSLQTILDKLHSMRCVTTRKNEFIIPVNKERHEMVGNIILSFSTLASAFRLKAPLPPYLPPVEHSRQRLVDAIRKLEVVRNREIKGSRQLLFFAYALTMKGVTEELEFLGRTLQNAYGVIGQTPEEFEALFVDPEESHRVISQIA
ncbi:hypothetical protein BD779DRAFT_1507033 [Infundibulicybe gibba]|nr:hypothetical protein BD779DRAFT_1507033 [Infundibulicybe gibba]